VSFVWSEHTAAGPLVTNRSYIATAGWLPWSISHGPRPTFDLPPNNILKRKKKAPYSIKSITPTPAATSPQFFGPLNVTRGFLSAPQLKGTGG